MQVVIKPVGRDRRFDKREGFFPVTSEAPGWESIPSQGLCVFIKGKIACSFICKKLWAAHYLDKWMVFPIPAQIINVFIFQKGNPQAKGFLLHMLQLTTNMQGVKRIDKRIAGNVAVQPRHLQIEIMDSLFVASNHSNPFA